MDPECFWYFVSKNGIKKILSISMIVINEAVPSAWQVGASRNDDMPVQKGHIRAFSAI